MKVKCKLIIGLGNPAEEYAKTYHNVGLLAVDYLAENAPIPKAIKSDVFMNQSGDFAKRALKKYKVKPEELLVIHDDNDIELGKYKISFARNSAGHRGVQSIIDSLGTKDFWRLRIGIRANPLLKKPNQRKSASRLKAGDLVLKKISKSDREVLYEVFKNIREQMQVL